MGKKQKLTYEEHEALGKELHTIRKILLSRTIQLSQVYGKSRRPTKLAEKAVIAVDKLQCEMDN